MRMIVLPYVSPPFFVAYSQQTFPYVSFMGQTLANHSNVDLRQVGSDGSGIDNVQCTTDLSTCCSRIDGLHRGDWYFPNDTRLPFSGGSVVIGESRGNRAVFVRRSGGIAIYRCDIAVAVHHPSVRDTVYLGLYFYSIYLSYQYCRASSAMQLIPLLLLNTLLNQTYLGTHNIDTTHDQCNRV